MPFKTTIDIRSNTRVKWNTDYDGNSMELINAKTKMFRTPVRVTRDRELLKGKTVSNTYTNVLKKANANCKTR